MCVVRMKGPARHENIICKVSNPHSALPLLPIGAQDRIMTPLQQTSSCIKIYKPSNNVSIFKPWVPSLSSVTGDTGGFWFKYITRPRHTHDKVTLHWELNIYKYLDIARSYIIWDLFKTKFKTLFIYFISELKPSYLHTALHYCLSERQVCWIYLSRSGSCSS